MRGLKRLLLVGVLLALPMASQAGDLVVSFAPDDPAMNTAIHQARGTLTVFWANALDPRGKSQANASLKVAFPINVPGSSNEIIWVSDFSRKSEGRYVGYLANEPNYMPNKHVGSKVRFTADQIRDWAYTDANGKLFGNYTTRVLVKRLPQNQAEPILDRLSKSPIPDSWKSP